MTPLIGKKVWFGPRGWMGWGWAPVSWEGWTVTGVALVAIVVVGRLTDDDASGLAAFGVTYIALALVAICIAKGTSPGGSRRRELFKAHRLATVDPEERARRLAARRIWEDEPDVEAIAERMHERNEHRKD